MCGIAGFVSLTGAPADRGAARAHGRRRCAIAAPTIAACSPTGPAALGAARLSIIDVAGGHQPISIDGGAVTVVQNGEIYNYVELRDELERARTPLRDGLRHRGDRAPLRDRGRRAASQKMRGMFAVAIWDAAARAAGAGARSRRQEAALLLRARTASCCSARRPRRFSRRSPTCPPVSAAALLDVLHVRLRRRAPARSSRACSRLDAGHRADRRRRDRRARDRAFWRWPDAPRARRDARRRRRSNGCARS